MIRCIDPKSTCHFKIQPAEWPIQRVPRGRLRRPKVGLRAKEAFGDPKSTCVPLLPPKSNP